MCPGCLIQLSGVPVEYCFRKKIRGQFSLSIVRKADAIDNNMGGTVGGVIVMQSEKNCEEG